MANISSCWHRKIAILIFHRKEDPIFDWTVNWTAATLRDFFVDGNFHEQHRLELPGRH